jgi:hypothetical protein
MKDNSTYMSIFPLQSSRGEMDGNEVVEFNGMDTNRIIKDEELLENVRNMIRYERIEDNAMNNYYKSITTKPMISKKPVKPLMDDYPLDESERLKVCETKIFVLKSYVNYL